MKNEFTALSNSDLLLKTRLLVGEEASVTAKIISCLEAIESRNLHLQMGYSSLFQFVTQELGYQEAQAYRRISAMRLVRELPALMPDVTAGALKLTTLTEAGKFFSQESKAGKPYSVEQKQELLTSLKGKSSRECERTFATLSPKPAPLDEIRPISAEESVIKFAASDELVKDLERLRQLWAHVTPNMGYGELISRMAKIALKKADPEVKASRKCAEARREGKANVVQKTQGESSQNMEGNARKKPNGNAAPIPEVRDVSRSHEGEERLVDRSTQSRPLSAPKKLPTRSIPAAVKAEVWKRDQGACTYRSVESGRKCGSKFMVQMDHVRPFAEGGPATLGNLRILCHAHHAHRHRG